jgi:hypothetical protein
LQFARSCVGCLNYLSWKLIPNDLFLLDFSHKLIVWESFGSKIFIYLNFFIIFVKKMKLHELFV